MRIYLCRLNICHYKHPNNIYYNDEHPNDINNIDTDKNSDVSNNDVLRNGVNNSNKNSNNYNNNSSNNEYVNSIDTENNIDNVKLCYNCKHRQSAHIIKNMVNLFYMLYNSFNNLAQKSSEDNSNTLISEKKHNNTVSYSLCHQFNQHLTINENYTTHDLFCPSFLLCMLENTV